MHPRSLHPLAAHGVHNVQIRSADRYWNIPALDGNSAVCLIIFLERRSTASAQMRVNVCGGGGLYIYEPTGNGGKCITRGLTICASVLLPLILCLMSGRRGCAETGKLPTHVTYGLHIHGSVHHDTQYTKMTNKMQLCRIIHHSQN
jgi:hypothetical protein